MFDACDVSGAHTQHDYGGTMSKMLGLARLNGQVRRGRM